MNPYQTVDNYSNLLGHLDLVLLLSQPLIFVKLPPKYRRVLQAYGYLLLVCSILASFITSFKTSDPDLVGYMMYKRSTSFMPTLVFLASKTVLLYKMKEDLTLNPFRIVALYFYGTPIFIIGKTPPVAPIAPIAPTALA